MGGHGIGLCYWCAFKSQGMNTIYCYRTNKVNLRGTAVIEKRVEGRALGYFSSQGTGKIKNK